MALPDFICIGAQKAGTTWLYEMLAQNPSVWMPPLKELHFLSYASNPKNAKREDADHWGPKEIRTHLERRIKEAGRQDKAYLDYLKSLGGSDVLSEDWYRRIFSYAGAEGKVKGEITPAYLAMGDKGIRYAKSLVGDKKFVLVIREPAARTLSNLKNSVYRRVKLASRETLWQRLMWRIRRHRSAKFDDAFWQKVLKQIKNNRRGEYSETIPRWQKHFGPEQLLILPFGEIKSSPDAFLAKVEAFIGAKPFGGYKALEEQVNKSKEFEIPQWVIDDVGQLMKPQQDFLRSHFGDEFYEKTK
jgi:hypothetical protein